MKYLNMVITGIVVCVSGVVSAEYKDNGNNIVQREKDSPQVNSADVDGIDGASEGKFALEYLDDIEDESEKYSGGKENTADTRITYANKGLSGKSSTCNTIWMHSWNKYKWGSYVPGVTVKTRLWLKTNTYLGGPTDPNLCGKPVHYSERLRHYGRALAVHTPSDTGTEFSVTMARVTSYQANNASWISSYRTKWNYGLDAVRANCLRSKHYSTNNGITFAKALTTDC